MAHERNYNSLEGLGSSHSCLDGVPFKIGPKFKPPDKIYIAPELLTVSRCNLLDQQYTFENEEGVLAWIRAKEETRRQQKIEAEERRARELEEFTQAMGTNSDSDEDGECDALVSSLGSNPNVNPSILNRVANPPIRPQFDGILMPTPIQSNVVPSTSDTKKVSSIDLSLFEKEKDAFENLDLQAINEMEELKNLFQDTQTFNVNPINDVNETTYVEDRNMNNSETEVKYPVAKPRKKLPEQIVKQTVPSSVKPVDEGDYVCLQVDYTKSCVMFNNDRKDNKNISPATALGDQLSFNRIDSGLYKPVLPPINNMSQTGLKPVMNGLNGINQQLTTVNSEQTFSHSHSPPDHVDSSQYSTNNIYENVSEVLRLCSAKSNPDLSVLPQRSVSPRFSMPHTPPPIPNRSVESSAIYENWNLKLKSVPPIPPIKPKPNAKPAVLSNNVSRSPLETDPYSTLCIEDQRFINKLGSMGFPRPRVSRAVAKLGQDEKEVIDHLCHVDSLIGKGYQPLKCESALFLFDNDIEKASNYIDSYSQFEELGFHAEKIREALIKSNVDRDKALDELMAS